MSAEGDEAVKPAGLDEGLDEEEGHPKSLLQRLDTARLVDRLAHDGKVQAARRADVAIGELHAERKRWYERVEEGELLLW